MIAQAVQSIRDAPRLICTVSSETKVLASIFSQLNSSFFQASKMADDTMRQFRELLDRMQALFSELEQALAGIAVGRLRLLDRVVWAGREDEVKHILADLLQQKASLNIMISIATGYTCTPDWATVSLY